MINGVLFVNLNTLQTIKYNGFDAHTIYIKHTRTSVLCEMEREQKNVYGIPIETKWF